jgi:hypothetical protein
MAPLHGKARRNQRDLPLKPAAFYGQARFYCRT